MPSVADRHPFASSDALGGPNTIGERNERRDQTDRVILVVEDDHAIRQMIELALGELGYTVLSAPDVATAVAHAREFRPALILLDVRLRGESGGDFVAAYGGADSQPIIVMTASQNPAAAAEQLGAAGWLAKPFNLDDLFALVSRHVPSPASASPPVLTT